MTGLESVGAHKHGYAKNVRNQWGGEAKCKVVKKLEHEMRYWRFTVGNSLSRKRVLLVAFSLLWLACYWSSEGAAQTLPAGFSEEIVFSDLTEPTAVEFASDGRVFVAEKSGIIKVFSSLSTPVPTVFADLRTNVHNYWDRGLLGMALHPNFPATPYIYVLYTYDAPIGGTAPRWGTVGGTSDNCPTPPGPTTDGCVVSARLSRLQAAGNVMTGAEKVLIDSWCQQFPSHSIGSLKFGSDGALYVSGGEGASFNYVDYGQTKNLCGDPPSILRLRRRLKGALCVVRALNVLQPSLPSLMDRFCESIPIREMPYRTTRWQPVAIPTNVGSLRMVCGIRFE